MNGCTITTITGHCDIWQEYKHSVRYTEVIKQAIHLNTQVYAQQILMQCQLKSLHAFRVKIWNKLYIKSNQLDVFVTIEKQHKNTILSMHRNSNYPILIKVTWITHTMTKNKQTENTKNSLFCMYVASWCSACFVCLLLYEPFCHGAFKLDLSTLFSTFFLWTSLQFILSNYSYSSGFKPYEIWQD